MQDGHPCVSFCPKQFHSSAHQVLSPWNTSIAFKTHLDASTTTVSPGGRDLLTRLPLLNSPCPAQPHNPPKCSLGLLLCRMPHRETPLEQPARGRWSISAGWGGSPQQGSTFPEVPTSLQLKYQQWVKSFQWTVKHNKTAALFPNQKLASLYRENCIPKHEGQLIWKFILVFSNLPVCLHTGQNKYDGQK